MIQSVHRLDGRGKRHLARRHKQCARRGKRRQTCDNAIPLHMGRFPYSLTEQLRSTVYSLEYQAMPSWVHPRPPSTWYSQASFV